MGLGITVGAEGEGGSTDEGDKLIISETIWLRSGPDESPATRWYGGRSIDGSSLSSGSPNGRPLTDRSLTGRSLTGGSVTGGSLTGRSLTSSSLTGGSLGESLTNGSFTGGSFVRTPSIRYSSDIMGLNSYCCINKQTHHSEN